MRPLFDALGKHFQKGKPLEKLYPLYEMIDTFLYSPSTPTSGSVHIRDGMDTKRLMVTVAQALLPCILWALYNTGLQANTLVSQEAATVGGWRGDLFFALGWSHDPGNVFSNLFLGALYFVPVFLVCNLVGGLWEALFAIVRKHEINEGFLVTGILFPLTLPPTIPLWQVALGISFGVVLGKEVFGGTGKNFLNVALLSRAFLFFAYPVEMSGDAIWYAVDSYTGATALGQAALGGPGAIESSLGFSWGDFFWGFVPGSMGETSAFACLLGGLYLIITGIGSWRIMLSVCMGVFGAALFFNALDSQANPMMSMSPAWHFVVGGLAFGTVFMATDPVTAPMSQAAHWAYGLLIGVMVVLIRVANPAFPEGTMLAILFANTFAPLMDHVFISLHIKKRALRSKNSGGRRG